MTFQHEFVKSMLKQGVLRLGDFTLKSGKQTPYFFNLGNVASGIGLKELGQAFATRIRECDLRPDVLFGPAYKGIPFVVATGVTMTEQGSDVGIAFNRKEAKSYGEGGWLIGSALENKRVVMLDDVVMDGATKIETATMVEQAGGELCGVVVGIDRMEFLNGSNTATEELANRLGVGVYSIASVVDVLEVLRSDDAYTDHFEFIQEYAEANCKL